MYDNTINHTIQDSEGNEIPYEISYNRIESHKMFFPEETKILICDLKITADKITPDDMSEILDLIKEFEKPYQIIME